jgi:hypothetical protein
MRPIYWKEGGGCYRLTDCEVATPVDNDIG